MKRSTMRMKRSQESRAFWLRRLSDFSESHRTWLQNHRTLG
jgi:hypothetical protein